MKDWNKDFYQSTLWQECRENYLISRHFICERCGDIAKIAHHKTYLTPANITDLTIAVGHDNLEALCQTCHNTEHHKAAPRLARYTFDPAGNVVQPPRGGNVVAAQQTEPEQ